MSQFADQHVVVTGGGSGIGAAIATAMTEAGARVTLMGRNAEKLRDKAEELGTDMQVADVTDRDQVATAFAAAARQNGRVTILVNNAGAAEAAAFRTHSHFKFPVPSDWKQGLKSSRVEWRCMESTGCDFIIDFGGQFTYHCGDKEKVILTQGNLLVPGACVIQP